MTSLVVVRPRLQRPHAGMMYSPGPACTHPRVMGSTVVLLHVHVLQAVQLQMLAKLEDLTDGILDTAPWKEEDTSQITRQLTMG